MLRHLFFLASTSGALALLASCFFPNGTKVPPDRAYQPCISTINVNSMCCALNITADESYYDQCLENGMCQDVKRGSNTADTYYRGFCTDKTWTSPNCLKACISTSIGGTPSEYMNMWECSDGLWCCGFQNSTCCDQKLGIELPPTMAPYRASIASLASTKTGSLSTSEISVPTCLSRTEKSSSNNGILIGLETTLGVLVIGLAIMSFLFWKRRLAGPKEVTSRIAADPPRESHVVFDLTSPLEVSPEAGQELLSIVRPEHEVAANVLAEMDGDNKI